MLAQTRLKLKNVESSITFIQEQHAKTLECMHKEIEQLQKKNARLTFDLAMIAPPTSTATDSTKCAGCQQLEEDLVSSKSEVLRINSALGSVKDTNALLQHQLKETEAKYTLDMDSKDEAIQSLTAELERKSNTIALITQQHRQLRVRFHQELESLARTSNVCTQCHHHADTTDTTSDTVNELQRTQYQFHGLRLTPNPPHSSITRRQVPATIQRRNFRRTTSSPVPCDISNITNVESSGSTHALPTPPISPKPLSYSSSPPQLRRASRPQRRLRQTESATGDRSEKTAKTRYKSDSSEQQQRSKVSTPLEPIKRQKSGIAPSELTDIIQSSQRSDQVVVKQSPPVLPPIDSSPKTDTSQDFTLSSSSFQATPPTGSRKQHRRFVLSKAQGLSSAPVRPMRVLCYNRTRLDTAMEAGKDEKVIPDAVERLVEDSARTELHQQSTTDS